MIDIDASKTKSLLLSSRFHQLHPSKLCRFSTALTDDSTSSSSSSSSIDPEIHRLKHIRNVGILAHVDAGKTTVTERMLALAGVVHRAGSVDSGNTVTDFLPAERERGITIQSAAISFQWGWHNNRDGDDYNTNDDVTVHLIDTPGHVDFSVEVNRSVAVLDGAVLVVDAVAGVQAQTETVWRAMRRPWVHSFYNNNHVLDDGSENNTTVHSLNRDSYEHEPLPCLALVNKMDKEGCHFANAIRSLKRKLPGANPVAVQLPLFWTAKGKPPSTGSSIPHCDIIAIPLNDTAYTDNEHTGPFMGIVDLIHMRTVLWPESTNVNNVDDCQPQVTNLLNANHEPNNPSCPITQIAQRARSELVAQLADVDSEMEEFFLMEQDPSNAQLRATLRRATLARKVLPVMAGAALKGKGVEPVLDAVADLLPSPLDRMPPALVRHEPMEWGATSKRKQKHKDKHKSKQQQQQQTQQQQEQKREEHSNKNLIQLGHPLHPSLLAMAFKVVHMKGRGGSGDGRVVFARVYSGKLRTKESVKCITPSLPGDEPTKPRVERVGAMLELAGGRFDNLEDGVCRSGDVCALVGLKSVVTGDTILLASDSKEKHSAVSNVCLAGVASPKPVLTVRLEAESSEQQTKLSHALKCLAIEDPSLYVEETESATLLSGLGELHIEITIDRLRREYGLEVATGNPAVAYRETVLERIETNGFFKYDRTIGGTRLEASVQVILEPSEVTQSKEASQVLSLIDPTVIIGTEARTFLEVDESAPEEELMYLSEVAKGLIAGIKGALRRGAIGPFPVGNVKCTVVNVAAEGGLKALEALPGSIRAAAANAISSLLSSEAGRAACSVLEPTMTVEVTVPGKMVGPVLSDLSTRRGLIGEVILGDEGDPDQAKAMIRGDVPLVEILGYASALRSLTGGEGIFTAEYVGHIPCDAPQRY